MGISGRDFLFICDVITRSIYFIFWQRTDKAYDPYFVPLEPLPAKEFLIYVVLLEGSLSQKANSLEIL